MTNIVFDELKLEGNQALRSSSSKRSYKNVKSKLFLSLRWGYTRAINSFLIFRVFFGLKKYSRIKHKKNSIFTRDLGNKFKRNSNRNKLTKTNFVFSCRWSSSRVNGLRKPREERILRVSFVLLIANYGSQLEIGRNSLLNLHRLANTTHWFFIKSHLRREIKLYTFFSARRFCRFFSCVVPK